MANILVERNSLSDIADSIRAKNGTQTTYKPSEMAAAIDALPSGGVTPTGELEITANGTYDVTNYASAEVDVPQSGITPTGTISITQNGTVDVTQYASAEVAVPTGGTPVINSLSVTENGTYAAPTGVDGYSPITVNVPTSGGLSFSVDEINSICFRKGSSSDIYVDFTELPNIGTLQNAFSGAWDVANWTSITIKPPISRKDTRNMFYCSSSKVDTALQSIIIDGTLLCLQSSQASLFGNRKALKTIQGILDFTNITRADAYSGTSASNNLFYNCQALENLEIVAGSMTLLTTNWNLSWCSALSDDSLVTIANALKDTYSGTVTFHATPKARLSSILGTVSVNDGLSIFEINAGGSVNLQDFLTTTKGVTLG